MSEYPFNPDWRVAPGETIKDILRERGMTSADLAAFLGPETADGLLDGSARLTPEIAETLEDAVGGSAAFWIERERGYRQPIVTDAQARVLKALREIVSDGWPATVREIAAHVGLRSLENVHYHLHALKALGLAQQHPRNPKGGWLDDEPPTD